MARLVADLPFSGVVRVIEFAYPLFALSVLSLICAISLFVFQLIEEWVYDEHALCPGPNEIMEVEWL